MLQIWIFQSDTNYLTVDGNRIEFSRSCPVEMNSVTEGSCTDLEHAATSDIKGSSGTEIDGETIVGAFVGGLAAGIALFGVGLCVCIW